MPDYVIKFEKAPDYKRFVASGLLTRLNFKLVTLDFFEETSSTLTQVVVDEEGNTTSTFEDWNLKNYIHASAVVSVETIPALIEQLQKVYHQATNDGE